MSLLGSIQGAAGQVAQIGGAVSTISNLFGRSSGNASSSVSDWQKQLRRASFGGVPFGVLEGQLRVGRRNAVHEYPFKDEVWVEDLGRAARRIALTGFLVENGAYLGNAGGGAVIAQRERLIAVCESPGETTLVHPTLGELKVSAIDTTFEERWDRGRVFEVAFSFIEAGQRVFPVAAPATGAMCMKAAGLADLAANSDFASAIGSALSKGASVVDMAVATAAPWARMATTLAGDATNLMNMVGSLSGSFGRFSGGRSRGIGNLAGTVASAGTTVSQLIATGTQARAAVAMAAAHLNAAAAVISG